MSLKILLPALHADIYMLPQSLNPRYAPMFDDLAPTQLIDAKLYISICGYRG